MVAWRTMADGVFFGGLQGSARAALPDWMGREGSCAGAEARNTQCAHWKRFSGQLYTLASVEGRR